MKNRKQLKMKWVFVMALLLAVLVFPQKVDAASAITRMESGKTYSRKLDGKSKFEKNIFVHP